MANPLFGQNRSDTSISRKLYSNASQPTHTNWHKIEYTWTASRTFAFNQYFHLTETTTVPYYIDICDLQVEVNKGSCTPFTITGRSDTESVVDLTGNVTLTPENLVYNSDGTFGFNGTTSVITSPSPISGDYETPFTLEAVVKKQAPVNSWQSIIGFTGTNRHMAFTDDTFKFGGNGGNGNTHVSVGNVNDGDNYHIVFTFDGVNAAGYLNGVKTTGSIGSNGGTIGTVFIGKYGAITTESSSSDIYLAKIYNRALTDAEVAQNFNAHRSRFGI